MILIKGAGDLASGVALRLYRAGLPLIMTDIAQPTAIRRTVSFCEAIQRGTAAVEGVRARHVQSAMDAPAVLRAGEIPVLVDPRAACVAQLAPAAVVDAILAKRNLGTALTDAPIVIALGPGFTAGQDCHAVVETMRGHSLGRVLYEGAALPNTGTPGEIGGFSKERILRAPRDGIFTQTAQIGAVVSAGEVLAYVDGVPLQATIGGVLRGILRSGTRVTKGMKSGDIDPRCAPSHCATVSDKALAVGGGVLEALLRLSAGSDRREALWKTM